MNAPTPAAALAPSPAEYRQIPLAAILPSRTRTQQMRRAHFDQAKLAELAESIKVSGVLEPVLVRAIDEDYLKIWAIKRPAGITQAYELVYGERRTVAAKLAGLAEIPCTVRVLTDAEVLRIQMVENVQREDLHPLEEAEGFSEMMKSHGYTVPMLVKELGRSRRSIYGRLTLANLQGKARKSLVDGDLPATIATTIARIPSAKLQDEAFGRIWGPNKWQRMTSDEAIQFVREHYMLDLPKSPFSTTKIYFIGNKLDRIQACTECRKRSGNMPDWDEVKNKDICTDAECHGLKVEAHAAEMRAEAEKAGQTVITGAAAKKILPNSNNFAHGHLTESEAKSYYGGNGKTINLISKLGKEAPPAMLVESPHDHALVKVYPTAEIESAAKKAGLITKVTDTDQSAKQRAAEKKARLETQVRLAILKATVDQAPLDHDALDDIVDTMWRGLGHDTQKRLCAVYGWEMPEWRQNGKRLAKLTKGWTGAQLGALLVAMALVGDCHVNSYSTSSKPEDLLNTAARAGVDHAAIRAEMEAAAKEKFKPKGKAKAAAKKSAARAESSKATPVKKSAAPAVKAKAGEGAKAPKVKDNSAPAAKEQKEEAGAAAPAAATAASFKIGDRVTVHKNAKGHTGKARKCAGRTGTVESITGSHYCLRFGPAAHEIVANLKASELIPAKPMTPAAAWPFPKSPESGGKAVKA